MPLIRLTKTDFAVAVTEITDMALVGPVYDGTGYNFTWTGRAGLLPIAAVAKAINQQNRQAMLRSIWIATDARTSNFFGVGDNVSILSSRLATRLAAATQLGPAILRLGIASPNDRIVFAIGVKAEIYSIEIMINTLDEGDSVAPELPVNNT